MRPLYEMSVIQIEVTNACHLKCANCTRHVGHHRKPYFMELDTVRAAIDSLEGFPGTIGMMGGEPTTHPKFAELCKIYQEMIPDRRKREFWTAGFKWDQYKDIILETFDKDRIAYNDHSTSGGRHQPLLVAIDDMVEDKELMWSLIDNCWVQSQWSASITPKGGFFCEIAASLDSLFDGPGGYPIEKGWWKRAPSDFQDQVKRYCPSCSAALPLERPSDGRGGRDGATVDWVSRGNAEKLLAAGSPKARMGQMQIIEGPYTLEDMAKLGGEWTPSNFREFVAHAPEDVEKKKAGCGC